MSFNKSILQNNTFRQIKRWFRFSSSLKRFKKYMPRHECENKRDFALAFRSSKNEQRRDKIDPYFLIRTDTTLLNVRCFWKRCSIFFSGFIEKTSCTTLIPHTIVKPSHQRASHIFLWEIIKAPSMMGQRKYRLIRLQSSLLIPGTSNSRIS